MKDEFPDIDACEFFLLYDTNEGSQDDNMETGGEIVDMIVIIVTILVLTIVGTIFYLKSKGRYIGARNKTVGEVFSYGFKKGNSVKYTDKDKDFMELIHELSMVYDNTDKFLNKNLSNR